MGDKTGISWTDATWNPVRGCSRVSEGCRHCYAERVAGRFCGPGQPYEGLATIRTGVNHTARWTGVVRLIPEHLADPLRWRKPRRIFVNSMSDLFHENLSNEQIAAVFGVMAAAPQHTFQVLTKRARRMREWFEWVASTGYAPGHVLCDGLDHVTPLDDHLVGDEFLTNLINVVNGMSAWKGSGWRTDGIANWPLPNVWLGVSVENQEAADERIPELLATPAAVRFLSCEPLIGPVDLLAHGHRQFLGNVVGEIAETMTGRTVELTVRPGVSWCIAGCESGPGARPCDVAWLRSLVEQCDAASVPFFLKQLVVDGKLRREMKDFPSDLQRMEFPQ